MDGQAGVETMLQESNEHVSGDHPCIFFASNATQHSSNVLRYPRKYEGVPKSRTANCCWSLVTSEFTRVVSEPIIKISST